MPECVIGASSATKPNTAKYVPNAVIPSISPQQAVPTPIAALPHFPLLQYLVDIVDTCP